MKKCKTIIAVVMAISMALSVFALVGCQPTSEKTQRDPEVQAVYEAYVAQAEEAGEDVLSYDEWLADLKASVKGEKGDKGDNGTNGKDGSSWRVGITEPANELGNDGDFYLNTETFDLYLKGAEGWDKLTNIKGADGQNGTNGTNGTDGKSAYELWKDANPESEMDEAQWLESLKGANGTNGTNGENGARGNKITKGEGAPTATEGAIEGDMYIDTTEWNVYFFEGTEWKGYGSIKGEKGEKGDSGSAGPVEPEGSLKVDIQADGEQTINIDLTEGMHIIEADLGATALSTGRLQAKVGEITSELVLSETRSEAAGGNKIYYGYVLVKGDVSEMTIMAKGEAVKASIEFKDWVVPKIVEDEPVEMPIYPKGTSEDDITHISFDESFLDGKYIIKLYASGISYNVGLFINSVDTANMFDGQYEQGVETNAITASSSTAYLIELSKKGDHVINPARVTFTAK